MRDLNSIQTVASRDSPMDTTLAGHSSVADTRDRARVASKAAPGRGGTTLRMHAHPMSKGKQAAQR